MKKNVAIIAGGYSSEHNVSLQSAEGLMSFIDREKYNVYKVIINKDSWHVQLSNDQKVNIDKNDFSFQINAEKNLFDFAYITIHGTPGEDGKLQGYLDMLKIPYSSCNTSTSALTFNKYFCTQFLKSQGITVSDSILIRKGQSISNEWIVSNLGIPVFIKPNDGGSSFGISKVKEESEIQIAIEKAFIEGNEVIIERYIPGIEVTCGCYKLNQKEVVFPVTEIVTSNDFFDYEAKYQGKVEEITPARLPNTLSDWIQKETLKIYDIIGAKGIIRIDYIIPSNQSPVLLEVNTTPGMTPTSFIPQQVKAAGLNMTDVMTEIIENSL